MNRRFNLLPHRQMRRRRTLNVFARQMAFVTVLAVTLSGLVASLLDLQNDYAEGYNNVLNDITIQQFGSYKRATELVARRDSLTKKKQILERVDARRTTSVLIMNDLVKNRPEGVYLTRLNENGDSFSIEGRALTGDAITRMFEGLRSSEYMDGLLLEEVQWIDQGVNAFAFSMQGKVRLVGSENLVTGSD